MAKERSKNGQLTDKAFRAEVERIVTELKALVNELDKVVYNEDSDPYSG